MSFRYHSIGTVFESRVHEGYVEVKNPNGTISKFQAGIKAEIPWSRKFFSSTRAMFAFEDYGLTYVGRRDGSWAAYSKEGLLMKLGNWKVPRESELKEVGCYSDFRVGPRIALLDCSDRRTVYIKGTEMVYLLNSPLTIEAIIPQSIGNVMSELSGLCISVIGGNINELESGKWIVSSNTQWGDNTIPMCIGHRGIG